MTADPLVIPHDLLARDAARLLDFYRVSGAPVVDQDGDVVGVVSQTNLVHALASAPLLDAWQWLLTRDLMSAPAVTVRGVLSMRPPSSWKPIGSTAGRDRCRRPHPDRDRDDD